MKLHFSNVIEAPLADVMVLVLRTKAGSDRMRWMVSLMSGEEPTILIEETEMESAKTVYTPTSFDVFREGLACVHIESGAFFARVIILVPAVKSLQFSTTLIKIAIHQRTEDSIVRVIGGEL